MGWRAMIQTLELKGRGLQGWIEGKDEVLRGYLCGLGACTACLFVHVINLGVYFMAQAAHTALLLESRYPLCILHSSRLVLVSKYLFSETVGVL